MGRRGRKRIDPETVSEILVMLKTNPDRPLASIAQDAGVDPKTVKKIKIKHDEELNCPFFSQRLKDVSHEVLMRICQDPSYDPAPDTTKLRDDENLPEISKHLLDMHRVREYLPRGVSRSSCLTVLASPCVSPRLPLRACLAARVAVLAAALASPRVSPRLASSACLAVWCPATVCIALASRRSAHPSVLSGLMPRFSRLHPLACVDSLAALNAMLAVLASLAL